jgi:hypothetical protein
MALLMPPFERSARRVDQLSNSQCVVPLGHVLEGHRHCRLAHGVLGSLQNLIEQRPKLGSRSKVLYGAGARNGMSAFVSSPGACSAM